eukprot:TRINITY_DN12652_c0_g1_i1.p1 TRINITY_DN12652_c0_g1~~TRINITY_DN12652_c0_g1_i1.p1  ORF type:complete len:203 (+),score=43.76 TRINITY_DN12652_c0_g1_i1:300-908(+)
MGREDGTPGPGRTLADKINQKFCHGGPCILYGDPANLTQYQGAVDYESLKKVAASLGPTPPPAPPSPPSPPAPPTPTPPPSPPGSEGVYLFEAAGSGKLFVEKSMFTRNDLSGRGGAAAWDCCAGAKFDNGNPLWSATTGSKVNQFQVKGNLKVRVAVECGKSHDYPSIPDLSRVYSAQDQNATFPQLTYLELAAEEATVVV